MMRKAVFLLMLAVLLVLLRPGTAPAATPGFSDIENNWARDTIVSFASKGFIKGYPDKTFRPDKSISRAEFTCVLLNASGITSSSADSSVATFKDTAKHWAHAQIAEAVQKGILVIAEYPNGLQPNGPILRSEAAAMMIRALGKTPDNSQSSFKDSSQIARSMYRGYIQAAYDAGLMHGYSDGTFRPFQGVTRAEACAMLSGLISNTGAQTASSTPSTPDAPSSSGDLTGLVVQGNQYDLASGQIYLRNNLANVPIHSISSSGGLVYINNTFTFALNGTADNPDLVVNNARYLSCKLSVSGSDLVAAPTSLELDSLTYNGSTYQADYVNLYIGNQNGDHYLSDAILVDQHTVQIADVSYDLGSTQIAISLGTDFYAIQGISFGISGISLNLTATSPVVMNSLNLSDITAIFIDSTPISLNTVSNLSFIINDNNYTLNNVTIDASGNFTANGQNYTPSQVTMIINNNFYQLQNVNSVNGKLIFYCTASSVTSWAEVNGNYVNASTVQIICGAGAYTLNNVLVVQDDVIRAGGQQYNTSNATCLINGTYYTIEDINYNSTLQMPTLETGESTGNSTVSLSSQPSSYVFYQNNSIYQNGAANATIYAGGTWAPFTSITFPDSSHFTYNNTVYALVGAQVQINGAAFVISDTAWRVNSQIMEVYLQS